jgi:hypothetical protein
MKGKVNQKCLRKPLNLESASPVFHESINEPVVIMIEPKVSANVEEVGERVKVDILVQAPKLRCEMASSGKIEGGINGDTSFAFKQRLRK